MTVELGFAEQGAGDPPLLLLHAFPLSSAMWRDVLPALAEGRRVIAPDLRGFGSSPLGDDPPSLSRSAEDVVALLDRLGIERAAAAGLSMGGYVALRLLDGHRERIAALVLADTKATADPPAAAANRERIAANVISDPDVVRRDVLPPLLGDSTRADRPDVVSWLDEIAGAAAPETVAWAQRAMAARPDSLGVLATTPAPVLLVRGAEDPLSTATDVAAMAGAVPEAEIVTVAGSGHLTAMETPAEFIGALTPFLDTL